MNNSSLHGRLLRHAHHGAVTLLVVFLALSGSSCSKDPVNPDSEKVQVELRLTLPENADAYDLTAVQISVSDIRNNTSTTHSADSKGFCRLLLDKGIYTIQARGEVKGIVLSGSLENLSVTGNSSIDLPLSLTTVRPEGLIFGEVFFNGETNKGRMMHPDQYFTIFNNSDQIVYADGLCVALTAHANPLGEDEFTVEMQKNNRIAVALIYAIPGNGTDYPVNPGEQIVIARSAQNHKDEDHPNSVDLSGADFEAYDPNDKMGGADNPSVPNLVPYFSAFGGFMMHPRGFMAPFLFKVEKDMKTFLAENQFEYTSKDQKKMTYAIPVDLVIDGIETGNSGALKVKSLPNAVDQGFVGVPGCHQGLLCIRKSETKNGRKYLKDTNNSTDDCEMRQGQTPYPAR